MEMILWWLSSSSTVKYKNISKWNMDLWALQKIIKKMGHEFTHHYKNALKKVSKYYFLHWNINRKNIKH